MKTTNNYQNDYYSNSYREQLSNAILESKNLGFIRPFLISAEMTITDDILHRTSVLLKSRLAQLEEILLNNWNNSCQTLSTNIFAHLNHQGIVANIILGNVTVKGVNAFDTTLENLQKEFLSTEPLTELQEVHAWVSLGDDTIIDAALLHGTEMGSIGRASEIFSRFQLQYQPILVGTEFFAKTNPPDPMELLNALRVISAGRQTV